MWHHNSHGHTVAASGQDFGLLLLMWEAGLGHWSFIFFYPKENQIELKPFLHSTVDETHAQRLWKNIPIVGVC